jgi:hypothetical protein
MIDSVGTVMTHPEKLSSIETILEREHWKDGIRLGYVFP